MGKSSVSVKPYGHSSTSKWVVSYTKDSRRRREFFRTKKEAATRRDQILIELENLGNKAFAISDDLRLEAVQCAEQLAPFKCSLSDAVDFYLAHLEASRKFSAVQLFELLPEDGCKTKGWLKLAREETGMSERTFHTLLKQVATDGSVTKDPVTRIWTTAALQCKS